MEKNKYLCPECGTEMLVSYEKPALNLTCPKCGLKIATTKWEEIDVDDKTYIIRLLPMSKFTLEHVKFLSSFIGENYIFCKKLLINGGTIYEGQAVDVLRKKKELDSNGFSFEITPDFKY